jgi:hypothetical protein
VRSSLISLLSSPTGSISSLVNFAKLELPFLHLTAAKKLLTLNSWPKFNRKVLIITQQPFPAVNVPR